MRAASGSEEAKALGRRVAEARRSRGLSVAKLAEAAGVSKAYVHQIENGDCPRPSAQVLFDIAQVLGTSIAHLLGRAPAEPEPGAANIPDELRMLAEKRDDMGLEDQEFLASIPFRGKRPRTSDEWELLWVTVKRLTKR
jgi:transcriptional regulator with XRE-family HTH domain